MTRKNKGKRPFEKLAKVGKSFNEQVIDGFGRFGMTVLRGGKKKRQ